ncbi:cell surface protein (Mas1) [Purpureocillium lilacinum]|uniref:Cell surface protein (Mas1) n=1 Tax=Purpureocillium lilacinum TaxID=33203 RepID=A0A179GCZ8_PURLI|nr:cell surface protein (Mas1) [Purpureocillium lilacinum]OAQ75360.1 cell surface protein (Mas1) [Purpureocillium lilacinum]OAQ80989.1 cell surface protein (Mas1) [Purpureocillium lilacinum]
MRYALIASALVASVQAHGLVRWVYGANGVKMPGLTVTDGTPRKCVVNACGAQADTGIIRDQDINAGIVGPLGKTQGHGKVDPETNVAVWLGNKPSQAAPANKGAADSVGVEDNLGAFAPQKTQKRSWRRDMMDTILGAAANTPVLGLSGIGPTKDTSDMGKEENIITKTAGEGKDKGLPTCGKDGVIELGYFQVNQDGAGPLTAAIDCTSGGKDPKAFKTAQVVQDAPGLGISGLSIATLVEYAVKVKMPKECTKCTGKLGGADNVCVVRVRNNALAGPFGGSGAFTCDLSGGKRSVVFTA